MKPRRGICVQHDMSPHRARMAISAALFIALLFVPGCRGTDGSDPVPSGLPGSYIYAAKGSTLKKPWEFSARLDLTPDRRYTFTLDKTIDGAKDSTERSTGTYAISGDQILMHEGEGQEKSSQDLHKLRISSDSLIADVGWTGELFLKGVGAPNVVFVKKRGG